MKKSKVPITTFLKKYLSETLENTLQWRFRTVKIMSYLFSSVYNKKIVLNTALKNKTRSFL